VARSGHIAPLGSSARQRLLVLAAGLTISLQIGTAAAASAAAPTCVVKLKVSTNDSSDGGTKAFVTKVLTAQGYRIIDDWLFTMWRASDFKVRIVLTSDVTPNYGFPVTLTTMRLFIADASGKVLVDDYVDRANLEDNLRNSIPACKAATGSGSRFGGEGMSVIARSRATKQSRAARSEGWIASLPSQ